MSKKPRFSQVEIITPTQIANIVLNDHLSEWIRLYDSSENPVISNMLRYLFSQGNSFEDKIVKCIPLEIVQIAPRYTREAADRTIEEIRKGTPVIWSAPLFSERSGMHGVADLLVKQSYLNRIVPGTISSEAKDNDPYIVIDIKFSTLPLCADGIHILNQDRYKAYKTQVWLYTQMVGEIQGITPSFAYILGRGYKYTSKGVSYSGNSSFERLGKVDFADFDSDIKKISTDAIEWLRNLRLHGKTWSFGTHPELYPNMNFVGNFMDKKVKIANQIGEITQLLYCGIEHRKIALSHGVHSWKDPRFTPELISLKGKQALTLQRILDVNRGTDNIIPNSTGLTNINRYIRKLNKEFFVDFETISGAFDDFSILPRNNGLNMIFMISVAWKSDTGAPDTGAPVADDTEEIHIRTFCVNSLTLSEEFRILREFSEFVGDSSELYHWGDAEPVQWANALHRVACLPGSNKISKLENRWTDLHFVVKEEPIAIKGCLSYSLKEFIGALHNLGIVDCEYVKSSSATNGEDAMILAFTEFSNMKTRKTSRILQEIEKYNQTDCLAIYNILAFLRKL